MRLALLLALIGSITLAIIAGWLVCLRFLGEGSLAVLLASFLVVAGVGIAVSLWAARQLDR